MASRASRSSTSSTGNSAIDGRFPTHLPGPAWTSSCSIRFPSGVLRQGIMRASPRQMPTASAVRRIGLTPASQYFPYPFTQHGQDFIFEPGISPEPRIVSPAWMGQRDKPGKTFLPASDRFGHPAPASAEVPRLGGSSDQYRQFEVGHRVQNAVSPGLSAHLGRRQVRTGIIVSRETECHGKDRETVPIIEILRRHSKPRTQSIPGRVRERSSQPVDPGPWRLPGNENRRRGRQPRYRPGAMRGSGLPKFRPAYSAGADFFFKTVDRLIHTLSTHESNRCSTFVIR